MATTTTACAHPHAPLYDGPRRTRSAKLECGNSAIKPTHILVLCFCQGSPSQDTWMSPDMLTWECDFFVCEIDHRLERGWRSTKIDDPAPVVCAAVLLTGGMRNCKGADDIFLRSVEPSLVCRYASLVPVSVTCGEGRPPYPRTLLRLCTAAPCFLHRCASAWGAHRPSAPERPCCRQAGTSGKHLISGMHIVTACGKAVS